MKEVYCGLDDEIEDGTINERIQQYLWDIECAIETSGTVISCCSVHPPEMRFQLWELTEHDVSIYMGCVSSRCAN